jgi:hypothetical protein
MQKSERNPKTEIRIARSTDYARWQIGQFSIFGNSNFGFLSDFGIRISDF